MTWYGIFISLGVVAGLLIAIYMGKKRKISSDDLITLALFVLPLSIIGARVYYCAFSGEQYTFLEMLKIWEGGLAVLGAIIGGLVGVILYSLIFKKNLIDLCDILAPAVLIGQAIGRIGCWFGGCCYGIESTNNLSFFPISIVIDGSWHYATFFYESAWTLIGFIVLLLIFKKFKLRGSSLGFYLLWYGVGRAIIESIRGDSLYLLNTGIKVSQFISILLIIVGIFILVYNYIRRKKNGENI